MASLVNLGIYYETFDKLDGKGHKIMVVFYQSSVLDVFAEIY